jgi:cell division protein FtsB
MTKISFTAGSSALNLILLAVLAMLAADALINPLGLRDLMVLRHDRLQLEHEREILADGNARRAATIERLRGDDAFLQRLIHQELGYVTADELIYRFADSSGPAPTSEGGPPAK